MGREPPDAAAISISGVEAKLGNLEQSRLREPPLWEIKVHITRFCALRRLHFRE